MKIDGLSLPASTPDTAAAGNKSVKDEFLRLLVAQLQHQDPLKPQDGTEFVAQLAQLAAVEQSAETNNRLASIQASQDAGIRSGYTSMVGKTVTAHVDSIDVPQTAGGPELLAHLDSPATQCDVKILDASGKEVRTISLGAQGAGDSSFGWDGKDASGKPVPAGKYQLQVSARDGSGNAVTAQAAVRGVVREVEFGADGVRFSLGTWKIGPGDVIAIAAPAAPSAAIVPETGKKELTHVNLDLTNYGLERLGSVWGSDRGSG